VAGWRLGLSGFFALTRRCPWPLLSHCMYSVVLAETLGVACLCLFSAYVPGVQPESKHPCDPQNCGLIYGPFP